MHCNAATRGAAGASEPGNAYLIAADLRDAARFPSMQLPGMPACCCAGKSFHREHLLWDAVLKSQSLLTSAVLHVAGLLLQEQPFARVARAQQAAHSTVRKQGPQAGAPASKQLTLIACVTCFPPSTAGCAQVVLSKEYCEAGGCQKRAVYPFEGVRGAVVCGQHKAKGMASPARACLCTIYSQVASVIALVYERSVATWQHVGSLCLYRGAEVHVKLQ